MIDKTIVLHKTMDLQQDQNMHKPGVNPKDVFHHLQACKCPTSNDWECSVADYPTIARAEPE